MPFDFCNPTIKVGIEKVPCVDEKGRENHVLVMHIDASPQVHANQADDVFLRVGDKSIADLKNAFSLIMTKESVTLKIKLYLMLQ